MKKLAIFTMIFTFLALIVGNLVVATNSGDACGVDWPKCKGSFLPDFSDYHSIIEYSHRLMTGLLGIVILVNAIASFVLNKEKSTKKLAVISVFFLLLQSMVGAFNVMLNTPPGFTTFDVLISEFLLLSVVLLAVSNHTAMFKNTKEGDKQLWNMSYKTFRTGFILFITQVILGAFFKHSRASHVVFDLYYEEYLIKSPMIAELLYSLHLMLTVLLFVFSLWFLFYNLKLKQLKHFGMIYFTLILLNAMSGIFIILTNNFQLFSSIHMMITSSTILVGGLIMGFYKYQ